MNELTSNGGRSSLRNNYYGGNYLWDSFLSPFFRDWQDYSVGFSGMSVDIGENENEYTLTADCPGVAKEDLDVSVNNGYLTVTVNRTTTESDDSKNYIVKERRGGSFSRSFHLSDVDEQKISADFRDGLLKVTMPKKEECKPRHRKIEIR